MSFSVNLKILVDTLNFYRTKLLIIKSTLISWGLWLIAEMLIRSREIQRILYENNLSFFLLLYLFFFRKRESFQVLFNITEVSSNDLISSHPIRRNVSRIYAHERNDLQNDIAIIEWEEPLELGTSLRKACLPPSSRCYKWVLYPSSSSSFSSYYYYYY